MNRAGQFTIFNFHGIGEPVVDVPDAELPYWCPATTWPLLAHQIAGLRDRGIPVAITFDDGNTSDVEHALPVLVQLGLTATFHPCAGRIGRRGYLAADQLRALRAAGMAIGSHGWSHVDLRRLAAGELAREADASRDALAQASDGPVDQFAIPFGSYDRRVLRALRSYRRVYTSDGEPARADSWLQPRYSYSDGWTPATITRLATEQSPAWCRLGRTVIGAVKRNR